MAWKWTMDPEGYPVVDLWDDDRLVLQVYESHGGGTAPGQSDADLIAAACSAAYEANPDNPIAAARSLPALVAFVRSLSREWGAAGDRRNLSNIETEAAQLIAQIEGLK